MYNVSRVQKKNKKGKINGYQLHALEYNGKKVTDDTLEVFVSQQDIANSQGIWARLTESQRETFKERARKLNTRVVNTEIRYNSLGQRICDVEKESLTIEEVRNKRRSYLERMLRDAAEIGTIDTKVFYLLSMSFFYESTANIYPAELAIAKYSLRDGVHDSMSISINPGDLEVGAANEAKQISEDTHKYKLPPNCIKEAESNYLKILLKIVDFLPQDEEFPIFFTEGCDEIDSKVLQSTQRAVKLIFERAQEYDLARKIKVYSIIELFFYLKELTTEITNHQDMYNRRSFNNFQDTLSKFRQTDDKIRYSTESCKYHYEMDVTPHCCLSKCLRYGYILSKWCCDDTKYQLKPGSHYPKSYAS